MAVRAKMVCTANDSQGVRMLPVTGGSEENEQFWKYTPAGSVNLHIDNEAAREQFEVGKEYYVDFTHAE